MRKLWVLILLIPALTYGQNFAKVGTVGAKFLQIGIGARAAGMGSAYEGICDDITAIFWNPSGLVHIENTSVFLSHTSWLADISMESFAAAKNIEDIGVIGFSMAYMGSGDIEITNELHPDGGIGNFNTEHWYAGVSFARRLTDKFAFGANAKFIRERLDDEASSAWATDLGVQYYTGFKSLRLAMSIRNFGPEIQLSGSYYDLDNGIPQSETRDYLPYHFPMTFKIGAAMELVDNDAYRLTADVDVEHPNDNVERLDTGLEFVMWKNIALRSGYSFFDDSRGIAFGCGFYWQKMGFDYSYTDYGLLDWVHRFDFTFNLQGN